MKHRRIAMVSLHTSPIEELGSADGGGMNVVEYHQALGLARLGHTVDLLTRRTAPEQPDWQDLAPRVRLGHLDAGPPRHLAKSQIDAHIDQFADGLGHLGGYDLYHAQHWMSGAAALDLARRQGVPHVIGFHSLAAGPGAELSAGEPAESPARLIGEARLAQQSDQVIAVSAAEAHTVIVRCGANPDKVTIIPPGVDLALFHPGPPTERPATATRPELAFASRLQPLKAPDLAIEALGLIAPAERPALSIAGAHSLDFAAYDQQLQALVRRFGLNEDVRFLGPQSQPQLATLFRRASLLLAPSHSETFSLVALEAAACGTPVLAAAAGGLKEAVVDGETGVLLTSREPAAWAQAISGLLDDRDRLTELGLLGRVHARRFTWEAMARKLAAVYEELWR